MRGGTSHRLGPEETALLKRHTGTVFEYVERHGPMIGGPAVSAEEIEILRKAGLVIAKAER